MPHDPIVPRRQPTTLQQPLSLLLSTLLFAVGINSALQFTLVAAVDTCNPIPPTSICAGFYPPGKYVSVGPTFNCSQDAETSLKSGPLIWSSLSILTSSIPGSTCSRDFAQLMCLAVYRPCNQILSRDFCQATLGSVNATTGAPISGSCPLQVQGFMSTVIPNFNIIFNCTTSPLFFPEPIGVGPLLPQNDPEHPIIVPADQCQPLAPSSICRGVIDYPVYVPWSLYGQQAYIEGQVAKSFTSAMITANVATGCLESLSKMLCSTVYMRCDTTVLQTTLAPYIPPTDPMAQILPALQIPFPRLPCRGLCQVVQEQCQELLTSQPALQALANCTGSGGTLIAQKTCKDVEVPNTAGANFPVTTSTLASIQLGPYKIPVTSRCNEFNTTAYSTSSLSTVFQCPYPLVRVSRVDDPGAILGGSCAPPCPSIMFTEDERKDSDAFYSTLVVLSFIFSLWLWLTWAIFPVKRRQVLSLMFSTCVLIAALSSLIALGHQNARPSKGNCKNATETYAQEDGGMCIFQSIILEYFSTAGCLFWLFSAFDLFLKIVLHRKIDPTEQTWLNRFYVLVGWIIPLILLIIGLSESGFGGDLSVVPWCLFDTVRSPSWVEWAVFYWPVLAIIICGCACMISIMVKIAASARAVGASRWRAFNTQIRPFIFVFTFIFIFTFIFAYRGTLYYHTDSYQSSAEEYVACLISTLGDHEICGDHPEERLNLGLWYCLKFCVAAQGILNTLIFGTQRSNFVLWYGLLTGYGVDYKGSTYSGKPESSKTSNGQAGSGGGIIGVGLTERAGSKGSKNNTAGGEKSSGNNTTRRQSTRGIPSRQQLSHPHRASSVGTSPPHSGRTMSIAGAQHQQTEMVSLPPHNVNSTSPESTLMYERDLLNERPLSPSTADEYPPTVSPPVELASSNEHHEHENGSAEPHLNDEGTPAVAASSHSPPVSPSFGAVLAPTSSTASDIDVLPLRASTSEQQQHQQQVQQQQQEAGDNDVVVHVAADAQPQVHNDEGQSSSQQE